MKLTTEAVITISNSKFHKAKLSLFEFSGCLKRSADLFEIMLDLLCVRIEVFNHIDLNNTKGVRVQNGTGAFCCKIYKPNTYSEILSAVAYTQPHSRM